MNDVTETKKQQQIAWPSWVVNEMSAAIYRSAHPSAQPADWAKLNDNQRRLYTGYCLAALDWIVKQGWVRLPRPGE